MTTSDIPTEALEAAIEYVIFSKFTQTEHGPTCPVRSSVTRCNCEIRRTVTRAVTAAAPHLIAEGRRQAAAELRAYADNYPEDVFRPGGTSTDAIAGTAMRHAYRNAAVIAEGTNHG